MDSHILPNSSDTRTGSPRRPQGASTAGSPTRALPARTRVSLISRDNSVDPELTESTDSIRPSGDNAAVAPGWTRWIGRIAVAGVWLYEGLWAKVLGGRPDQSEVAASLPFLNGTAPEMILLTVGLVETLFAVWVLSGWKPRRAGVVQVTLLLGMSATGLIFARGIIDHPGEMIVMNASFLALILLLGRQGNDP